jgi:hypothetical protein
MVREKFPILLLCGRPASSVRGGTSRTPLDQLLLDSVHFNLGFSRVRSVALRVLLDSNATADLFIHSIGAGRDLYALRGSTNR